VILLYFLEETVTKRYALCVLLFLLSLTSSSLLSQIATTSLRGAVKDPSGAVVPGAVVTLTDNATGNVFQSKSGNSGDYQFNQIPPAKYTIKVSATGFADQSKVAELLVNQPATVDFAVSVQASAEVVNVSAEAQTLNLTDASIGNSVNNTMIEALPMEGRNVPDLLSLQPGVLYLGRQIDADSDSRSGAVAGARSDQTNVTLDGLDDNDQNNGYAFTGVLRSTLDSTEEFRVTTTSSDADAGRTSGAQVTLITKSGTNQFHGSLYEYNRNTAAVANDWFNKAAQVEEGLPNVPGKLIRNTFGGSIGGPVKKDKLFFFFNYEGQRTAENRQITQTVPTASFKAGNITYPTDGGSIVTLNPMQVAAMDPNCGGNGTCPWGAGVDPYMQTVLNNIPTANGTAEGDGLNLGSYTFSSPYPGTLNTTILKLDYTPTERHRIFVRGNLQKDTQAGNLQFPGQLPSTTLEDNTKGIAAGDSWTISPNMMNDIRYGFIRQGYSLAGIGQGDYVTLRFLSQPVSETRSTIIHVPVHNVIDNISWTKGKHALQAGGNWRLVFNNRDSNFSSFNSGNTNVYWLNTGGAIANYGTSLDPAAFGFPAVCCGGSPTGGFTNSYDIAIGTLVGLVPQVTGNYNYNVSKDGTTGTLLPDGTSLDRHYKANEFEYYVQDSWRVLPNLTVTYGLRHTILQTPYETNGQQVAPTVDMDQWFRNRYQAALTGGVDQPDVLFAPAGPAHGRPGYWPKQKMNLAPRIAFAYGPDAKTSIRGGFGLYFDHYGEGIVNSFDELGSFGLSSSISNPAGTYSVDNSPRFTGLSALPPNACAQPATLQYPYTAPDNVNCGLAISWGIDNKLKTPYAETLDFSVQRELPGGFTFEAAYVGRFGRHLLQQLDLAEPVPLADTKSGMGYFAAATQLSKLVDINGGNPNASVPAIPYFEDLFPDAAGTDAAGDGAPGNSATQNIYTDVWAGNRGNETTALLNMDVYCYPGCGGQTNRFYQPQFSSLYAWATIGMSSYNAGQFILRHPSSHGLQLDLSYTLSNSIDMGSDTERSNEISSGENSPLGNEATSFSEIINSFNPSLNRGVSDFDTRHLITLDWVYQLPFGRGQHFVGSASKLMDAFIGGWQWSGLNRWSSGLPFSVFESGWSTNYQEESGMVATAPIKLHKHIFNGSPEVFADPNAINNGIATGSPMRNPYPGEAGQRNNFRGDGYFDIDSGLRKSWKVTESQSVRFAWEVFNVTNSVRFDTSPQSVYGGLNGAAGSGTLGAYSSTLTLPRVQQFSLRYDF
jgi:hypothetical protein